MFALQLRMWLLLAALFAVIYAVVVVIGTYLGIYDFYFYFIAALVMMLIQYLVGPKIVEWTMGVKYITKQQNPRLFEIVESLARRAQIPTPKIGISPMAIPNAFAFGCSIKDGRVCVTQAILNLLDEDELKAVLGHELAH